MFETKTTPFAEEGEALQIALNLARIYEHVLEEPLPVELERLIERLAARNGGSLG